jgi:hypothetical protein
MNAEESPIKSSVFQQKPFHRANQLQKIKRTLMLPSLMPKFPTDMSLIQNWLIQKNFKGIHIGKKTPEI